MSNPAKMLLVGPRIILRSPRSRVSEERYSSSTSLYQHSGRERLQWESDALSNHAALPTMKPVAGSVIRRPCDNADTRRWPQTDTTQDPADDARSNPDPELLEFARTLTHPYLVQAGQVPAEDLGQAFLGCPAKARGDRRGESAVPAVLAHGIRPPPVSGGRTGGQHPAERDLPDANLEVAEPGAAPPDGCRRFLQEGRDRDENSEATKTFRPR